MTRLSAEELSEFRAAVQAFWAEGSRARGYETKDPAWIEAITGEQWAVMASRLLDHIDDLDPAAAERIGEGVAG